MVAIVSPATAVSFVVRLLGILGFIRELDSLSYKKALNKA